VVLVREDGKHGGSEVKHVEENITLISLLLSTSSFSLFFFIPPITRSGPPNKNKNTNLAQFMPGIKFKSSINFIIFSIINQSNINNQFIS